MLCVLFQRFSEVVKSVCVCVCRIENAPSSLILFSSLDKLCRKSTWRQRPPTPEVAARSACCLIWCKQNPSQEKREFETCLQSKVVGGSQGHDWMDPWAEGALVDTIGTCCKLIVLSKWPPSSLPTLQWRLSEHCIPFSITGPSIFQKHSKGILDQRREQNCLEFCFRAGSDANP